MNTPSSLLFAIVQDALIKGDISIESYSALFEGMFSYANKNGASVIEIDMDETISELHTVLNLEIEDNSN